MTSKPNQGDKDSSASASPSTPKAGSKQSDNFSPKKYRKKPVVIDALRWTGSNPSQVRQFTDDPFGRHVNFFAGQVRIHTLEGTMFADPGDYIIRGIKGELYPCKPDIFAESYEEVIGLVPPDNTDDLDSAIKKILYKWETDGLQKTIDRFKRLISTTNSKKED